jgi:hypothetical protein
MYIPKRDYRFEYLDEVCAHIEETSCSLGCVHAEPDHEYLSVTCPIMAKIWDEEPMEEFDDRGDEGVFCKARVSPDTIGQGVLF